MLRVFFLVVVFSLAGVAAAAAQASRASSAALDQALDPEARAWVDRTLSSMTLEQKVGQVLVPGVTTGFAAVDSDRLKTVLENIEKYHVGGYHAFGGDVLSAAYMIKRMQDQATVPLLITADFEGGSGLILRGGTRFPKAMAIGATYDPRNAYEAGRVTAREAQAVGVHVNFYPVADVNNNARNPIINIRSFGEDPARVGEMVQAYIRGCQEQGVIATAKHFPGHGDTAIDSHLDLPIIGADRERLNAVELPPFRAAIEAGVGAVMTAHLFVPALEKRQGLPATLSPAILTDLLRKELNFQGLVFTDGMNMGGIVQNFSDEEATVRAFEAGADLILLPPSVEKSYEGLLRAVRHKKIKPERLDDSVRRILEAKARLGLHKTVSVDLARIDEIVACADHEKVAHDIMDRAVTLVRDDKKALPFKGLKDNQELTVITVLDDRRGTDTRGYEFVRNLRERHANTVQYEALPSLSPGEVRYLVELARRTDYVVVGAYIRVSDSKGSIDLAPTQIELLKGLSKIDKPFAFALFGSPYLLSFVPELPSYVLTYDDHPGAELSAAKAIMGEIPFRGKLPISLPDFYPIGHGIVSAEK
jgi:beta-N-acetylhexosaminidase